MPEVKGHIVPEISWLTLASKVYKKYGSIVLNVYTDEDWVTKTLIQYNGKEGAHGFYNFKGIEQQATPRLSSATALRAAVMADDRDAFSRAAGVDADTPIAGHAFFDVVKHYLMPHAAKAAAKPVKKKVKQPEQDVAENKLGEPIPWPAVANKIGSAMKAMGWKAQRKGDDAFMFSTKGAEDESQYYMVMIDNEGDGMFSYALGTFEDGRPDIGEHGKLPTTEASVSEVLMAIRDGYGLMEDDAGDVEQRMIAKIAKYKERLAHLKKTDPEAYKREMEKRKTSSRIPPVSTFEDQGVAEGPGFDKWADDRAASQLHKLKPGMVQDRKTGKWYDPKKEFDKKMNSPEVMAQMKRMAQKEGVAEESLEEYGDTAKGQKMLTKVQKRAVDRVVSKKADTDPAYAKKNKDTADRAWDRMTDKDVAENAWDRLQREKALESAGVGIITKQNSTVDVNKNTPKKNLKAFRLI